MVTCGVNRPRFRGFKIDGRLHVGTADIRVLGRRFAQEIVGDRITIRKKGSGSGKCCPCP